MITQMNNRSYRQKRRALQQEETRQRIVTAAMQLHGEVGPRHSSIKAIAERAGVQRLTVYRHFADEAQLFRACSAHWLELNPPPSAELWRQEPDASRRIEIALAAYTAYYSATAYMWEKIYRDLPLTDALVEPMAAFESGLDAAGRGLLPAGLGGKKKKLTAATLRHAMSFAAWQSLEQRHIADRDKLRLYQCWISGCLEENSPATANKRSRSAG